MRRAALLGCSALFSTMITIQPIFAASPMATETAPQAHGLEPPLIGQGSTARYTDQQIIALVRSKVKYVFVIYQENRSFDSYFGTFPGANGLYSQPAAQTPGFSQTLIQTDGTASTISPFRIGPKQYAWDTDDIDHSHGRTVAKMDVTGGIPKMDRFALTEERKYSPTGNPSIKAVQYGELAMAHEDCDTVPFLWHYADNFVLFDNVFETMTGPSTPGNLSIFAAQTGQTQWAEHPEEAFTNPAETNGAGEPVLNDDDPLWGSPADPFKNVPVNPGDFPGYGIQLNQTYASLAVTLAGGKLQGITNQDQDPSADLADIRDDIPFVTGTGKSLIDWGWFEEGYSNQSSGSGPVDAGGLHASYITHHNGPQYFGYVSNNPVERGNLHGLHDFFSTVGGGGLPASGGVYYLKGGYQNIAGLKPVNPVAKAVANFRGDDDHPAYSDAQISEALVAREINTIARSKYWPQSAIIITWDDSEGDYDHVPPPVITTGPDQLPMSFGPRVPLLVISPFAKVHQISHQQGSQSSVVTFIDEVFNLNPLASLPDEAKAQQQGQQEFGIAHLGPLDAGISEVGDLMSAFDPARLTGAAPALPASYAEIPDKVVNTLPHYAGRGCAADGLTPQDQVIGISNAIPANFNPLPSTNPTPGS